MLFCTTLLNDNNIYNFIFAKLNKNNSYIKHLITENMITVEYSVVMLNYIGHRELISSEDKMIYFVFT